MKKISPVAVYALKRKLSEVPPARWSRHACRQAGSRPPRRWDEARQFFNHAIPPSEEADTVVSYPPRKSESANIAILNSELGTETCRATSEEGLPLSPFSGASCYVRPWLLLVILLLAAFLRFWQLGSNPAGFFCDEASIGYNAYSLLETGRDEHGNSWPLFFRAFGEYKSPIMVYSAMPSIALLGLNEFSVRLTSTLYGILGVIAIYFLGKIIFGPKIGLFSALFLAISPWHVHLSRIAFEQMPFVFFTTLATYCWFKHWREVKGTHRPRMAFANLGGVFLFVISIILFAFALYSYFPARIFIPLLALGLMIIELRGLLKQPNKFLMGMALAILLITPMVGHFLSGSGFSRWHQVKGEKTPLEVVGLYLNHFSPDFLFTKGDIDFPGQFITRHSVKRLGELYLFQLPFLILGFLVLLKKFDFRQPESKILLLWLLLYPLGSAFTNASGPQATRSVIGVIPFQIISAVGLAQILTGIKKSKIKRPLNNVFPFVILNLIQNLYRFQVKPGMTRKRMLFNSLKIKDLIIFSIITLSFVHYLKLLNRYPLYSSDYWGWQYGPREIVSYFLNHQEEYDQLIMSGEFNAPYIFLKFYGQDIGVTL